MSTLREHEQQIIRWILSVALIIGAIDMSTESILIVQEGAGYWMSIATTVVLHGGALALLWLSPSWGRWAAFAAFLSDLLLSLYLLSDLIGTSQLLLWDWLIEGQPVLTSALFVWVAWMFVPEEVKR